MMGMDRKTFMAFLAWVISLPIYVGVFWVWIGVIRQTESFEGVLYWRLFAVSFLFVLYYGIFLGLKFVIQRFFFNKEMMAMAFLEDLSRSLLSFRTIEELTSFLMTKLPSFMMLRSVKIVFDQAPKTPHVFLITEQPLPSFLVLDTTCDNFTAVEMGYIQQLITLIKIPVENLRLLDDLRRHIDRLSELRKAFFQTQQELLVLTGETELVSQFSAWLSHVVGLVVVELRVDLQRLYRDDRLIEDEEFYNRIQVKCRELGRLTATFQETERFDMGAIS